jgi:hypothetical protein
MLVLHGRIPTTFVKEKPYKNFTGDTIFVDGKTDLVHHHHQVSLRVGYTLQGKNRFIKMFRADNATFNAITFSSVGAHHQSGAAKRSIMTITSWS